MLSAGFVGLQKILDPATTKAVIAQEDLVVGAIAFLIYLSRPYETTTEEFEKRAAEAPSLLSAGFVGLQKILDPATTKAVIAQEDLREGRFCGTGKGRWTRGG